MTSNFTCVICFDDKAAADWLLFSSHKCHCHRDCLATWLEKGSSCPICRTHMRPDAAVLLSEPESEIFEAYCKSRGQMRAAEQRQILAEARLMMRAPTLGKEPDHLSEKSRLMSVLNAAYRAHESVSDALESQIRRIRADADADLMYLAEVYLSRVFDEPGSAHVSTAV